MKFNVLLGVRFIHLIDRADLFEISDLVLGGEVIVMDMHSSQMKFSRKTTFL
jgi:hypothetical protein